MVEEKRLAKFGISWSAALDARNSNSIPEVKELKKSLSIDQALANRTEQKLNKTTTKER